MAAEVTETELQLLRRTFQLAQETRDAGNAPFGALLADDNGTILLEHANGVGTTNDATDHAETGLIRKAAGVISQEVIARSTVFTSTEPCGMCACSIYWAGCRRVVYGTPDSVLAEWSKQPGYIPKEHPMSGGAPMVASRSVLRGPNGLGINRVVVGPVLEEESLRPHQGYWGPASV